MKEILKKNKFTICCIAIAVVIVIATVSYAYLQTTVNGGKKNIIRAGVLELKLDESATEGISIPNAYPVTDTEGLSSEPYTFVLENTGNIDSNYVIYLDDEDIDSSKTRMLDSIVKYNLDKDGETTTNFLTTIGTNPNRVLDRGTINSGDKINYNLRVWMDYNADNSNQGSVFNTKLRITGEQVTD